MVAPTIFLIRKRKGGLLLFLYSQKQKGGILMNFEMLHPADQIVMLMNRIYYYDHDLGRQPFRP